MKSFVSPRKVAILQPQIRHYREEFYALLSNDVSVDVFCYENPEFGTKNDFQSSTIESIHIACWRLGPFMWYNPFRFINGDYETIVLMLDFKHLSTWFILLTKYFHRKRVIVWGHGISIKRFITQSKAPFIPLKWFLSLADGVWFYTENELTMWKRWLPKLNAVSLNNTISYVREICDYSQSDLSLKKSLKNKYNIVEDVIFIFCARFNNLRRTDLLVQAISRLDNAKFGFIIIGSGEFKPDFGEYSNVYDFGKVYEFSIKRDLFSIADIYFQPAWLGLSIVEAMAYRKPIFSFKRASQVYQCVEYYYVEDKINGRLFNDVEEFILAVSSISEEEIITMGNSSINYVINNLMMDKMVRRALSLV